ncbi:hypothetical protein D3C84_1171310 [compost metagenome]
MQWFRVELLQIGKKLSLAGNETDAQAILRITTALLKNGDRLNGYVEEVKSGLIVRVQPHSKEVLALKNDRSLE